MKFVKLVLIAIAFLINVAVARPALANRLPLDQNPDYITINETLSTLTQAQDTQTPLEGLSLQDVQARIDGLRYQKYIMETGTDTICRNDTTQTIAVYGAKPKNSTATFDQVIYLLPAGEETDDDFTCTGVYLPKDATVTGLTLESAAAVKILDGTQLVLTEDPNTGAIAFNLPPASILKAGDANWEIPDLAQADLTTQFPAAPID